jgi:hypothetical protein
MSCLTLTRDLPLCYCNANMVLVHAGLKLGVAPLFCVEADVGGGLGVCWVFTPGICIGRCCIGVVAELLPMRFGVLVPLLEPCCFTNYARNASWGAFTAVRFLYRGSY